MKKIILFLFLAVTLTCFAQKEDNLANVSIKFYGIDYSMVRVYGATETPTQFIAAFYAINQLFISEPKKYDIEKHSGVSVSEISMNAVNEVNSKITPSNLVTTNQNYTLSDQEIVQAIKQLPIKKEPEIGMVIIAKLLNKTEGYGTYQIVFFNTDTKEIIKSSPTSGKARGFGLRNFWAGSIYQVLKRLN